MLGPACQEAWSSLLKYATDADAEWILYAGIPWFLLVSIYWVVGVAFLPLDFWPALSDSLFWRTRKCQKDKSPTLADVKKIGADVGFQQLTVYPLGIYLLMPLMKARLHISPELPTQSEFLWACLANAIFSEIWFYYGHRLLHSKPLYSLIHKKHHLFTSPISLECLYFHWWESLQNLGVVAAGPLVLRSHVCMLYVWTAVSMVNILGHHCGYELPGDWTPLTKSLSHFHDYHHKVFSKNFGVLGFCDWLHGTDKGYREYLDKWEADRAAGGSAADDARKRS